MKDILEYSKLKKSIELLDKWFDNFLKGKGKKLDHEKIDKSLWSEYDSKYSEYVKLSQKLRLMETK